MAHSLVQRWNAPAVVFAVLSLCVTVTNLSALRGDYVYDDQILPHHPMLDDWEDVALAFVRSSQEYLASATSGGGPKGVTYRPLPMASFALTQATAGSLPWLHHVVSLSFHLIAVWFLILCARGKQDRELLPPGAILTLVVFALHPVGVEAYGWINGRSDAMAGAALCAMAWTLRDSKVSAPRLFILACMGCLCKETFLVASLALLAAWHSTLDGADRTQPLRVWLTWCAAACVFFVLRTYAGTAAGSGLSLASLRVALISSARLASLSCDAFIFPRPAPMLLLASALHEAVTLKELVASGLWIVFAAHMARARNWRGLTLLSGALITVLPTGLISNGFWLGFDRYLYMPACLLFLSFDPWLPALKERSLPWLAIPLALFLGWESYVEGTFYASPERFAMSMVEARPSDPTGTLFLIQLSAERRDWNQVRALVATIPTTNLPATLLQRVIVAKSTFGTPAETQVLLEEAQRRFPGDPRFERYLRTR